MIKSQVHFSIFTSFLQQSSLKTEKRELDSCNVITLIWQKSRNVPASRFRRPWKVPRGRALFYIQGMLFHRCFSYSNVWLESKKKSFLLGSSQKKRIPQWSVFGPWLMNFCLPSYLLPKIPLELTNIGYIFRKICFKKRSNQKVLAHISYSTNLILLYKNHFQNVSPEIQILKDL